METRSGPLNEKEGKDLRVLCPSCDTETNHTILRSVEYTTEYSESRFWMRCWDEYQIVECKGCQTISFRHSSQNTENSDNDPETGEEFLLDTVHLYPPRLQGRAELNGVTMLPWPIQPVYREVMTALRNEMPVLAGVGIRALVESLCKDQGASGANLEKKIDDLASKGVVSKGGAETLHSLRIMGNQAAHEVLPHTLADLGAAMDVVEHALAGIYVIPQRASRLPRRVVPPAPPVAPTAD